MSKLQELRCKNRDWLLTSLTIVLVLMIFVFVPLQAGGEPTCSPRPTVRRLSDNVPNMPIVLIDDAGVVGRSPSGLGP